MKTVSLSGSQRESVGKKDAKKQRKEGLIPCVLYGGKKQVHFVLNDLDFGKLIFTPDVYLVNLEIGKEKYQAILQDVQYHPVTDRVLHVDFMQVSDKPISIRIPLSFSGNVPGVMAGGRLIKKMRKLLVKGMVEDLPDIIDIDMSKLKIGDSIKVRDLNLDNLTLLDPPNSVIVLVKTARALVEIEAEEEEEGEESEGGEDSAESEGSDEKE